jgi:alpha-amylase/alpha-mannosidase (GH57 family)
MTFVHLFSLPGSLIAGRQERYYMIESKISTEPTEPVIGQAYLCIHGHFYQPPRENPFTGVLPLEPGATPFANYNEKITAECYRPNAEAGNFAAMSYDLGPTLASWLETQQPSVYQRIIEADRAHLRRYGVGNAMAQAYNHTILPLATSRDRRTQIAWGLRDFRERYGREARGMWLAETAVDLECLELLAQAGIRYTVLAPWQAAPSEEPFDPTEPYIVSLPSGRSLTVFFYNAPLSGGVSFDSNMTNDANNFAEHHLAQQLVQSKREAGQPQLLLVATDGELYGHHKAWRDKFLSYLFNYGAPAHGFEICSLEHYMRLHPATREVQLRVPSAWSCAHGVARWGVGCDCTEGDSSWKSELRQALANLAQRGDQLFEQYAGQALTDPWSARDDYLALRNGWESEAHFWAQHGKGHLLPEPQLAWRTRLLLEAQYYHQYSFTSCAFFFEDLDRIEPRNNIGFARRAISLTWQALGVDLQQSFVKDLQSARSWRTGVTGADLYRRLPVIPEGLLPPLDV